MIAAEPINSDTMRNRGYDYISRIGNPKDGLILVGIIKSNKEQTHWGARQATASAKALGYGPDGVADSTGHKCLGQVLLAMDHGHCGSVVAERRTPGEVGRRYRKRHWQPHIEVAYRLYFNGRSVAWAVEHGGAVAIALSVQQAFELCVRQIEVMLGVKR